MVLLAKPYNSRTKEVIHGMEREMSDGFDGTLSSVSRAEAMKRLRTNEALEEDLIRANKDIQVLAKQVENFVSLFHDDFNHDDGAWFLDANIDEFLETAEELVNKYKDKQMNEEIERKFPVLLRRNEHPDCPRFVKWSELDDKWAMRVHGGQDLEKLASRGGLYPVEIVFNVNKLEWGTEVDIKFAINLVKSIAAEKDKQ